MRAVSGNEAEKVKGWVSKITGPFLIGASHYTY